MWKHKFIVCLHCAVQHGTESLEVALMKTRSTSQHRGATELVSLGSLTTYNTALAWSDCHWALSWCLCKLRKWLGGCSGHTGGCLIKLRFALCGQSLCSSSCRVLVLLGFAVKNLSVMKCPWVQWEGKKRNLTKKIWFFNKYMGEGFVNVLMEINYSQKIHSVLSQAAHHGFVSCKGDLLLKWGFTHQNCFNLKLNAFKNRFWD